MNCGAAIALSAIPAAYAQADTIVVTARKKEENLQQTPLSIIALPAGELEKQNISDLSGLNERTPNVFLGAGGGFGSSNAAFYVRGIGADRNAINQEAAVAVYVDDVYYSRSDGALFNILDVEQIEITRGPQGTLYGRNATAGSIRYITREPDLESFSAQLDVTGGSFARIDARGIVNLPLSEQFAIRVTAATLNQNGYVTNALGQDLGDVSTQIVRGQALWSPSDRLRVLGVFDYTRTDNNGSATSLTGYDGTQLFPILAAGAGFDTDPNFVGSTTRSASVLDSFYQSDNVSGSLTLDYDLNDSLSFKSVTAYRDIGIEANYDFDTAAGALLENRDVTRNIKAFSQELQLGGTIGERLDWIGGFFYYDEESDDRRFVAFAGDPTAPGGTIRSNPFHGIESISFFGQSTLNVTDRFSITGGLRWNRDKKSIIATELAQDGTPLTFLPTDVNGNSGPLIISAEDTYKALSGRVSLEYDLSDTVFAFASYARGFRAGALNDRPRANFDVATQMDPSVNYGINSVDPEKLDTYEVGFRSVLADNRVRFNATFFYQELKDFQVANQVGSITLLENAAAAEAYGIETEIDLFLSEDLSIDFTGAWLETEITEADPGTPFTVGNGLGNSPEFSFSVGGNYEFDIGQGNVISRLDYSYQDDFFSNPANDLRFQLPGYGLLSANVRYTAPSGRWSIAAYGKNLTDKEYFSQALNFTDIVLGFAQGTPGRGIEGGATLTIKFGDTSD